MGESELAKREKEAIYRAALVRLPQAERERDEARQQRDALARAMWEARAILGFDNDGDATPGARIAGMGWEGFRQSFLHDMEEQRRDYDECIEEIKLPGEIRAAKEESGGG